MPTAKSKIKKQQQQIVSPFLMLFFEDGEKQGTEDINDFNNKNQSKYYQIFNF